MKIEEIVSNELSEKYYKTTHKSGLDIYVFPKEGYRSTYAIFGTKYGSVNRCFSVDGGEKVTVPDGIAHYLEHKLFESEDGDAFARYAKTGANANAYTSFSKTCYLFSCSDNFEDSLRILLDFVTSPYFTPQTVQKEQGIIGQEIKMYDDSPDWRVMFNMLEAMYEKHPVKIDIAGTVESISHITAELLYQCYNTFYNLGNMALCVAGNADMETVLKIADEVLKEQKPKKVESFFEPESEGVSKDYVEQEFPVAVPLFNLGFKENGSKKLSDEEAALNEIVMTMLFSSTGKLYTRLLDAGLINSSFCYEFSEGPGYAVSILSGESREPEKVAKMIKDYIEKVKRDGFEEEDFEIAKKTVYGDLIGSFNSPSFIGNALMDCALFGGNLFNYANAVANADMDGAKKRLDNMLMTDRSVLSVIVPQKQ